MTSDGGSGVDRRTFLVVGALASLGVATTLGATPVPGGEAPRVQGRRILGRTGLEVPDIAFGTFRLKAGDEGLVRYALDVGVTHFDTAESYGGGESERTLGRALVGRRSRCTITSKVVAASDGKRAAFMRTLEESLGRLRTDHVDVYLNHAVNDVARLANPEWQAFVADAKRQGKIRFAGMSGHAGKLIECLDYALDHDLADTLLVAYNFGQDPKFYERFLKQTDMVAIQPDLPRVLQKAKARHVGVQTMKTLMGARLNDMRPFETGGATFAQAAFRWVLSSPDVDGVVVTMPSRERVDEYLGASGAKTLAIEDGDLLARYASLQAGGYCRHGCGVCESSCPYGVEIGEVLRTRMYARDYGAVDLARREYASLAVDATACLSCSAQPCAGTCPHGLAPNLLARGTHVLLS
jgi:predicted aldo/keto reductase-like oxidoreductase